MAEREMPRPQEIYRHFKEENLLYQIITIAEHTETGEKLVVYQALYGEFKIYARPLSVFMSETDKSKYPDVKERYRFTRVNTKVFTHEESGKKASTEEQRENKGSSAVTGDVPGPSEEYSEREDLMRFLDAETYEERRNLLIHMRPRMTDRLIDSIAASMDITVEEGETDARFASLLKCIRTLEKYEITR